MPVFNFKRFAVDDHGCGMKICTDSVLIGAWARICAARSIIDLGAGSGLLALMCAQRNAEASVTAIEIDPAAYAAACANFAASPWPGRLSAVCADAPAYAPEAPIDAIISNPPYFTSGLLSPDSQRAMARHCASLSPMAAIDLAALWLAPEGTLAMVTPAAGADAIICHAEMRRLKLRRQCAVSTSPRKSPTRMLWEFSRIDGPIEKTALSIRLPGGAFSPEYLDLTNDFYL